MTSPPLYRLRRTVTLRPQSHGRFVLADSDGAAVRVTASTSLLVDSLTQGASFEQLTHVLRSAFPHAMGVEAKLSSLLEHLHRCGLLEGAPATTPSRPRRAWRFDIDPALEAMTRPLRRLPRALGLSLFVALTVTAAILIVGLLLDDRRPRFTELKESVGLAASIAILFGAIPLHELAHALGCRLTGHRVIEAGVGWAGFGLPRPYLLTDISAVFAGRVDRFVIAASGPLSDLVVAGASALVITSRADGTLKRVAVVLFWYCLASVAIGTSPLNSGDGAKMADAVLDDDMAARSLWLGAMSRLSNPRHIRLLKVFVVAQMAITLLVFVIGLL